MSDALKRAAVRFGVGVSLYAIPQTFLDGEVKYLTAQHSTFLRDRYTAWLDAHGAQAFGDPLDHGDAPDGSVGDPDDGAVPEPARPPVRQAVVDEDDCFVGHRHRRAIAAIRLFTPFELA